MTDENHPIDLDAKEWMKARLDEECERLQANNVRPIPLTPLNCGLFVDNQGSPKRAKSIVNRVELCTNFDFDKVIQLMVSEPIDYPGKQNYLYVNVLLWTDKPIPLIIPYLYDQSYRTDPKSNSENTLNEWMFVNQSGKSSRHRIKQFVG